ncbi:gastrula zinc finger protein XlCGF66.1-like [Bufo bufo]|uniref:gastrula zinc finger protein XlCGF66.1-like n=1 Tax=Bufo bufo TaxID=8384 RepID=UPI001ABDDC38|nr:gastrula zinc finger protein XlCGF66.1-like [Bufo bufo]
MDGDRDKMAERILNLTLEILFLLTGEDYTVVKKNSSGCCQAPVSESPVGTLSPIMWPSLHPLIIEKKNKKILEVVHKMMELLTGEVPIRCQDVAVYFSMEEWEYLEGHKCLNKEVKIEGDQPLTSPERSSQRTTPERCPRPLLPQDGQVTEIFPIAGHCYGHWLAAVVTCPHQWNVDSQSPGTCGGGHGVMKPTTSGGDQVSMNPPQVRSL